MPSPRPPGLTVVVPLLALLAGIVPAMALGAVPAGAVAGRPPTAGPAPSSTATHAPEITGGAPNLVTAVGYLTNSTNLADGNHYEPFGPGFPDFGLTIDAALGLAATKSANSTLANMVAYIRDNADGWTGIGTSDISGGAIGKEALIAEVVGADPRNFGGNDLIAALDQTVCASVSTGSDTSCPAVGSYANSPSIFSQALGIMAQLRAGDAANAASPISYLESVQASSGAWPSLIPSTGDADVDSTGLAVMALTLVPGTTAATAVNKGIAWIAVQQEADGGFPGTSGENTNSAAVALLAMNLDPHRYRTQIDAGLAFLASEQNSDGGFNVSSDPGSQLGSDLRASAQAVGGVVGTSFGTLSDPLPLPPPPPVGTTAAGGGSSSTPTGVAAAHVPGIGASGAGIGALTVARYAGDPTSGAVPAGTGIYYDVQLATNSAFDAVTITVCNLGNGGLSMTWWNGEHWLPFSDQGYDPASGCVTASVTDVTAPTQSQLGGTPVAPSADPGPSDGQGYWEVASDGGIFSFGDARFHGSMGGTALDEPIVGMAPTGDGQGYWEVASDGGIFSFGDARFHGSMGGTPLDEPIVGMAPTGDGQGYWEVASDGGIFSFGDARFHGSMGGTPLDEPIVGMAPTGDGQGYWEVASDGGIFSFGDARFHGSMGGTPLDEPIVGMAPTGDGQGYWEVASDGGIFSFGDARFHGSMGGTPLDEPIVGMAPTGDGQGYWEVASDGGIFSFGDARFHGSMGGTPLDEPIVGMAPTRSA